MLELDLLLPILLGRDELGSLELSELQLLDLGLILDPQPDCGLLLLVVELLLLLDQLRVHF